MVADLPRDIPAEVIEMTNEYREEHGMPSLVYDLELQKAAQLRAEAIVANRTFKHDGFGDVIAQTSYAYGRPSVFVGENLSCGFRRSDSIFSAWLRSPLHKKNIVEERFKSVGVATIRGDVGFGKCQGEKLIVVQMFGEV